MLGISLGLCPFSFSYIVAVRAKVSLLNFCFPTVKEDCCFPLIQPLAIVIPLEYNADEGHAGSDACCSIARIVL